MQRAQAVLLALRTRRALPPRGRQGVAVIRARVALASAALLALVACSARAEGPSPLIFGNESAALPDASLGFLTNSAAGGARGGSELGFAYRDRDQAENGWLFAGEIGNFGVAYSKDDDASHHWVLNAARGQGHMRSGASMTWISPEGGARVLDYGLGLLIAPGPALSFGGTAAHLTEPDFLGAPLERQWGVALALRPLAMVGPSAAQGARLTLTADANWHDRGDLGVAQLRFGGELAVTRDLLVRGSIEDHRGWHVAIVLRSERAALSGHAAYDTEDVRLERTWAATFQEPEQTRASPTRGGRRAQ